jgi:hypothetical protein
MPPSTPTQTLVWFVTLLALAALGIYLTQKPKPPARNEQRMRRHRRIQERQLGEAYRDDGFICHPLLIFIGIILGAHALFAFGYFIFTAVMGAAEPRW